MPVRISERLLYIYYNYNFYILLVNNDAYITFDDSEHPYAVQSFSESLNMLTKQKVSKCFNPTPGKQKLFIKVVSTYCILEIFCMNSMHDNFLLFMKAVNNNKYCEFQARIQSLPYADTQENIRRRILYQKKSGGAKRVNENKLICWYIMFNSCGEESKI